MSSRRRPSTPLHRESLDRLALRYVERFATTRARLASYLDRKVRERGWEGPPADTAAIDERLAALGYVDDRAFAEAKARSLARRGLGARRVALALRQARVEEADAADFVPAIPEQALDAALTFARRKRFGPFGSTGDDRAVQQRQIAAMVRAGHDFALARRIVTARNADLLTESY